MFDLKFQPYESRRSYMVNAFSVMACIGLLIQLLGFLLITDGSRYSTLITIFLFVPAIILLFMLGKKEACAFFRQRAVGVFLVLLLYVFVYAVFVFALNKEYEADYLKHWIKITIYSFLYVFFISYLIANSSEWFFRCLLVFCLLASFFAFMTLIKVYLFDKGSLDYRATRLYDLGIYGLANLRNPILSALYYAAAAIAAIYCYFKCERGWLKGLVTVGFLFLNMYVFFTFSRSVWLGLFCAYIVFLSVFFGRVKLVFLAFLAIAILGFLIVKFAFYSDFEISLTYRDMIWNEWLSRLPGFWLLGIGPGADFNVCINIIDSRQDCFNQAHNLYMQFWYQYGFFGILLFCVFILSLFKTAVGVGEQKALYALGASWMIFALTSGVAAYHEFFTRPSIYWVVFWVPVGVLIGVHHLKEKRL